MTEPALRDPALKDTERLLRRLSRRRALARLALLFERLWPALWPPLGVAGLFVGLALFGIVGLLPPWLHAALLAVVAVAILVLLGRGLRGVGTPDGAAADRRLEQASGLRHRPLAVLTDRPALAAAVAEPAVAGLWREHVRRAIGQVRQARVGLPHPGLARHDPRALRGGLVVALVAALVVAGPDAPARLAAAVRPGLPLAPAPPSSQLQAWVTPPAYTGLAPLFLKPAGGAVSVPAGSHLVANLTGGVGGAPSLVLGGHAEPFQPLDAASFQAERDLTSGGRLAVRREGRDLAAWDVTVLAPQAPRITWAEPPGPAPRGLQVRLPWQVADEYGVDQLRAELRLRDRPAAPPVLLSVPVPNGTAKSAKGVSLQDLTANPWAGLTVTARLVGRNAAGLVGSSAEAEFSLPERAFRHPVARRLIAIRKRLSLDPDDRATATAELDRMLLDPAALGGDDGAFLNLADIYYRLVRDREAAAVGEAQALMWSLALHLDEGGAERTARALEAAREAAREALDTATRQPTDANRAALEQRLAELEKAIRDHMAALLEQARRENAQAPSDPDAQRLDSREFERMAEAARDAAQQGRMDEARDRMAELERMLDQLRNARIEHGPSDGQNAGKRQRGREQMGAVQDMIGREGKLLDHAQSRAGQDQSRSGGRPDAPRPGGAPPAGARPPGAPPQAGGQDTGREADRRVQQALRRALGELMQQFGDLAGQIPQSLGQADSAMRDAGEALATGQDGAAEQAQQRAVEALQKGGSEMGQMLAKQLGRGQPGEGEQGGEPDGTAGLSLQDGRSDREGSADGPLPGQRGRSSKLDPLGRELNQGTSGSDEADAVRVPEEMERQRTKAIQDELRRRGGERARPQPELDYIDRLLKQF